MSSTRLTEAEIVDVCSSLDYFADWCADHASWRTEMAALNADNPQAIEEHGAVADERRAQEERLRALSDRLIRAATITVEDQSS